MDINTLYEFDLEKGKRKVMFKARDIIEVSEVSHESKFNTIRVNTGNRIITLGFLQFAMAKKWKQLLELASRNANDVEQNGVKIKKNIDPLLVELAEKTLYERLVKFYEDTRPVDYLIPQLIEFLSRVKFELESISEAALAKQPPRPELISFTLTSSTRRSLMRSS